MPSAPAPPPAVPASAPEEEPRLLRVAEVAERMGLSKSNIYELIRIGRLESCKIG